MLKKIIALVLTLALTVGLLAGCGAAQEPVLLSPEEIAEYSLRWQAVLDGYLADIIARRGPNDEFSHSSLMGFEPCFPYIRRDGEAVIAEIVLLYQPTLAMLTDGLLWGETPRWEGDWCIAPRQILINHIGGEWQFGGTAIDGLNTADFREFTQAERAACRDYSLTPREQDPDGRLPYYRTPASSVGDLADVTVTDLRVTDAAPDRFTGLTLEEIPREVTVELPEKNGTALLPLMIPRRGDRVRVVSLPTEGEIDRIPSEKLRAVVELLPSDLGA